MTANTCIAAHSR